MTKRQQLAIHRNSIQAIAAQYGATNIRIFGSVARGDDRLDSDIDFLIDLDREWSLLDRISLKQDLEDLLGSPVDIATSQNLRPMFKAKILQDAIAL